MDNESNVKTSPQVVAIVILGNRKKTAQPQMFAMLILIAYETLKHTTAFLILQFMIKYLVIDIFNSVETYTNYLHD